MKWASFSFYKTIKSGAQTFLVSTLKICDLLSVEFYFSILFSRFILVHLSQLIQTPVSCIIISNELTQLKYKEKIWHDLSSLKEKMMNFYLLPSIADVHSTNDDDDGDYTSVDTVDIIDLKLWIRFEDH